MEDTKSISGIREKSIETKRDWFASRQFDSAAIKSIGHAPDSMAVTTLLIAPFDSNCSPTRFHRFQLPQGFLQLNRFTIHSFPCSKFASCLFAAHKVVEHDAAPFNLISWKQQ